MSKIKSKFPLLASLEGHSSYIYCVVFHPSAPILAAGSDDNGIILWDIDTYKPIATLLGHTGAVTCLAFHPSEPLLVSGGADNMMRMWDTTTYQCLSTTDAYRHSSVSCVAFRPHLNGTESFDMITGSTRDLLKLWKISPDKKGVILVDEVSPPSWSDYGGLASKCIVFHPTKPLVATAARTGGSVFDIDPPRWGRPEKLSELMALDGRGKHRAQTSTIAFHPSAPIVVTGGNDKKIKLWELLTTGRKYAAAECVETLDHEGDVTSVAFHPTTPFIFSCSRDKTIKVWYMAPDQMSAFCIDTLTAQSGFTSLMVHPSGRFFATGCEDGTTNLWDCSILNIDTQFKMARMRGLERDLISGLIPPESMYGMRDPREYLRNRVIRQRTRRVMLLEHPSAKTATAQENAVRLAELWAKSPKPRSPSPKSGSPKSPKPRSPSPKSGSPKSSKPRSPSPKTDQHGSGGSITRRRKSRKSHKSRKSRKSRKS